ncbi:hypothetical protein CGZ95_12715 [Enemella evansiae]|uniref:SMP-30/gluconolactonase/LRE family protein n=1 Tax=Enemella evansiae TaxID=2016499 RepID=UPI000B95DE83|nr:SMP-30/gluconolactonase/LRE family protein [Enemella evansiae]OYN98071.1 hypothetical protein CGZ95_12715 [Enemella evansiae]
MSGTEADPLRARVLDPAHRFTGEGACWDPMTDSLVWVDIWAGQVLRTGLEGETELVWATMPPVGFACPTADGLLVGAGLDLWLLPPSGIAAHVCRVAGAPDGSRINDGAIDAHGRVWFGTVTPQGMDSILFRYADGRLEPVLQGLSVANGIDWSPSGDRIYLADTGTGIIHAAAYDPGSGATGPFETWAQRDPGAPDGLCVTPDGAVWVAEIFTGRVVELVDGRPRRELLVPCPRVTSVAYGAGRLFVTTGTKDLTDEQLREHPDAGSLYFTREI